MSQNTKAYLPPQDLDAEQALLGSVLINNNLLDDVIDKLRPDYFYDKKHQTLYGIFLDLWQNKKPIDVLTVLNWAEKNLKPEEKQDLELSEDFLVSLVSKSSLVGSILSAQGKVKEEFLLRTIIQTADEIKRLALENKSESREILDQAQEKLYQISQDSLEQNFIPISEVLGDTFERINALYQQKSEYRGVPCGFTDLDKILGGFHKSDLIILAARPSMGKTALALEFIRRVAMSQNTGVGVFSLEMSKDQLVDRMLSAVSKIDAWRIRTGKFNPEKEQEEFAKLGNAIGKLDEAPIWIDDSGSLNVLELRSKARRLKSRHNVGLLVIDYLQLMSGHSNKNYNANRVQEVSEISRSLKLLAKELDMPVLALSQLSRGVEGRDDKRPMLSDLRESGSIEQDADVVMFVHRQAMYERDMEKRREIEHEADILVAKHRNGSVGAAKLAWLQNLATFENLEGARISRRVGE